MVSRTELLVFGCTTSDVETLHAATGPVGLELRAAKSTADLARAAVSRRPLAVIINIGMANRADLDVIPLIHAMREDLPVVVIGEDDSLELERFARQEDIFYYFIHPIETSEVEAVLRDLIRCAESRTT